MPDGIRFGILEGSTFCICDERGDIDFETGGLFAEDTRFLSLLLLTINGQRPLVLSSDKVEYFSAAFYMRNPLADGLKQDQLSIARNRFIGVGMQDHITIENQTLEAVSFEFALEFGSDFADIFAVKEHDFALGDPLRAKPLPPLVPVHYDSDNGQLLLEDSGNGNVARTQIVLSPPGEADGSTVRYRIELEPRQRWNLRVDVATSLDGEVAMPKQVERRFGDERDRVMDSVTAWRLRVPQLHAGWYDLEHAFQRSVSDLAALRMRGGAAGGRLPAAGMPWFMTVFGRDTIITCLQTLLFGPELARSALGALAELQAKEDDAMIDAEPGKIVHEVRHGKAAQNWFECYYGTVDATPLYLILLSEVWRWTDDAAFVRGLREPAMAALRWIDEYGDLDGDGLSSTSGAASTGSRTSPGRTPTTRSASRTGASPSRRSPRSRCRATSTTPSAEWPSSRAASGVTASWPSGSTGTRRRCTRASTTSSGRSEGRLLRSCARQGQGPVDSPARIWGTSCGVARAARTGGRRGRRADGRRAVVRLGGAHHGRDRGRLQPALVPRRHRLAARQLPDRLGPRLLRPLAGDAAHRPPHPRRRRLLRLRAARGLRRLPRADTPFPIAYPTAARPQAWAAGTPVLLLQILLGLRPDRDKQILARRRRRASFVGGALRLTGCRAFDRSWDVRLEEGHVGVEEIR